MTTTKDPKKTMMGWAAGNEPAETDTQVTYGLPEYLQYSQPAQYPQATAAEQQQYGQQPPPQGMPLYPPSYQQPSYVPTASPYVEQPYTQPGYDAAPSSPYGHRPTPSPWSSPDSASSYAHHGSTEPPAAAPTYAQQPRTAQGTAQPPYAQHGNAHQPSYEQPPYEQPPYEQPSYDQAGYPQATQYPHAVPQQPSYPQAPAGFAYVAPQPAPVTAVPSTKKSKPSKQPRPIAGANATAGVPERVKFIRRTYLHLLGAILAFAGLLYLLMTNATLTSKVSAPLIKFALGGRWNWGVVLAVFMVVSWVADTWASHAKSKFMQYAGLGFYIVAEALIFVPLLAIVAWKTQAIIAKGGGNPNIIRDSAFVTMGIFTALTASVFISKKDFSFLRSGLMMASGAALMLIVLSLTFGFNLGLVFSVAMVLLAAAYILYQTSQVLAHYDPSQHVAASLALFSSVALMFWYVIRIFMRARE